MFHYLSYVSKSESHGWQRISREYIWPDAILRDGCEFVAVVDDDDYIYFTYVDSERGADNSIGHERRNKATVSRNRAHDRLVESMTRSWWRS